MSALLGRKLRIEGSADGNSPWNTVAGAQSDKVAITRGGVDISDKDSDAWRQMLGDVTDIMVDIDVSGVFKGTELLVQALDPNTTLFHYRVNFDGLGTMTGLWFMENVEFDAENKEEVKFSAKLKSSGPIAWVAAA